MSAANITDCQRFENLYSPNSAAFNDINRRK